MNWETLSFVSSTNIHSVQNVKNRQMSKTKSYPHEGQILMGLTSDLNNTGCNFSFGMRYIWQTQG